MVRVPRWLFPLVILVLVIAYGAALGAALMARHRQEALSADTTRQADSIVHAIVADLSVARVPENLPSMISPIVVPGSDEAASRRAVFLVVDPALTTRTAYQQIQYLVSDDGRTLGRVTYSVEEDDRIGPQSGSRTAGSIPDGRDGFFFLQVSHQRFDPLQPPDPLHNPYRQDEYRIRVWVSEGQGRETAISDAQALVKVSTLTP